MENRPPLGPKRPPPGRHEGESAYPPKSAATPPVGRRRRLPPPAVAPPPTSPLPFSSLPSFSFCFLHCGSKTRLLPISRYWQPWCPDPRAGWMDPCAPWPDLTFPLCCLGLMRSPAGLALWPQCGSSWQRRPFSTTGWHLRPGL